MKELDEISEEDVIISEQPNFNSKKPIILPIVVISLLYGMVFNTVISMRNDGLNKETIEQRFRDTFKTSHYLIKPARELAYLVKGTGNVDYKK